MSDTRLPEREAIDSLFLPLGVSQYGKQVGVDLVKDAGHIAIQGKTRSGKSQASYNLLARVASNPAVRVVGSDPTEVLLAPFQDRLPEERHLVLGVDNQERTEEMLRWVKNLSDRRISKMRELRIDKYELFSARFPLLLLVLEEFPGILEAADDQDIIEDRKAGKKVGNRIRALVRQIAAQSAKAGVRILLLAQRAEANILGGNARSNFAIKMSLRVDEPESLKMLHPSATPEDCEAAGLFKPGQAFFDRPGDGRQIIRNHFVGEYRKYFDYVLSCDPKFLGNNRRDQAQREILADEFPAVGDVDATK